MKALIYEKNLKYLTKLRDLFSSLEQIHQIKIANDEEGCIGLLKNDYFDFLILPIDSDEFKNKLLKVSPELTSLPIISTSSSIDLQSFKKCRTIEVNENLKVLPFLNAFMEIVPGASNLEEENNPSLGNFIPIKIPILKKIYIIPCDIFIKLGKSKFVKIINQNDSASIELFEGYEIKNVKEFFIRNSDFYKYSDELLGNLLPDSSQFDSKFDYYRNSQQVINDIVFEIGITEKVIELSKEVSDSAISELKDSTINDLVSKFKYSKERYIYDHSVLTSIFAVAICEKFDWKSRQVMQKIASAAIFHDFGFENPKLAFLELDPKENPDITREQRAEIIGHPEKIASILSKNSSVSSEVLSIVSKHHEAHGEAGYPNAVSSAGLSVLECVFLVAHEFANELYKIAFRPEKISIAVQNVVDYSNSGNLRQVTKAFLEVVDEKYHQKK